MFSLLPDEVVFQRPPEIGALDYNQSCSYDHLCIGIGSSGTAIAFHQGEHPLAPCTSLSTFSLSPRFPQGWTRVVAKPQTFSTTQSCTEIAMAVRDALQFPRLFFLYCLRARLCAVRAAAATDTRMQENSRSLLWSFTCFIRILGIDVDHGSMSSCHGNYHRTILCCSDSLLRCNVCRHPMHLASLMRVDLFLCSSCALVVH